MPTHGPRGNPHNRPTARRPAASRPAARRPVSPGAAGVARRPARAKPGLARRPVGRGR